MAARPVLECIVTAFSVVTLTAAPVSGQSSTLVSQTIWGTTGHEAVDGVAVGPDGSIYLTGIHSLIGPPLKIFLVKFAANGSIAWQQTWDGPDPFFDSRPTDVAVSPDGAAVYVTGTSFFNPNNAVLLKFNTADGSLVFDRSWGGTAFPQGVAVHTDGSIYVAGSIRPADIDQMFVTKFDAGGNVLWTRAWETPESAGASGGEDVALDAAGNVYAVGETPIPDPANPGGILGFQVALLKLDGAGNLLWQRTVAEGEQLDARGGLSVGPDGSIYVAGARLDPRDSGFDGLVLKFAPDGTLVWNRAWGGRGHDEADGVAVRADGTVLMTGTTNSFSDGDDVFFLELQPGGKATDAAVWGNPGNATENGNAIAVSAVGDAVIGATVQDPPYAFLKAPTHTSRLRAVVGDPGFSLVALAVDNVTAGGTVEPVAGTTNDDPGFDAAVIVIRP